MVSVTIDEIAKKLGLSRSTVSRALNDHPRISQDTKQRVQVLAQQMGYVPNYVAQSLSAKRTRSLGMVITHVSDPFIWEVIDGVEQVMSEEGYSLFLSMARGNREREIGVIEEFQRRRVDGIIVASSHLITRYSDHLTHVKIPVILINNHVEGENLKSVSHDAYAGAQMAVQHLIDLGHRHIGYIGVPNRINSNQIRHRAFQDTLRMAGIPQENQYSYSPQGTSDFACGQIPGQAIIADGVTAVFCYNDMVALGLLAELNALEVKVPQQISVIGFDDIDPAHHSIPALTTIRQPRLAMGRIAAQLLLRAFSNEPIENQILPCELVIRQTTHPV